MLVSRRLEAHILPGPEVSVSYRKQKFKETTSLKKSEDYYVRITWKLFKLFSQ